MSDDLVRITFLGDIMCEGKMLDGFKTNGGFDFTLAFEPMKSYFRNSNYVCANLETPISGNNDNLTCGLWSFNSPMEFAEAIKNCGIHFVATANNHCLDRGIDGIKSTINSLDKIGLKHTGVFSSKQLKNTPLIEDIEGIKIGFLSYTYGTNAFSNGCYLNQENDWMVNQFQNQELSFRLSRYCFHNPLSRITRLYNKIRKLIYPYNLNRMVYERKEFSFFKRIKLERDVKRLRRAGADIIVMYMHAGGQYNSKETDSTIKLTDFLKECGIEIIVGSHEHVVHGSSISSNNIVAYSLGNFLGTYGTIEKPYDKDAEFSIALNAYINPRLKKIEGISFSVLKTIRGKESEYAIQTYPLYDLIQMVEDKEKQKPLVNQMLRIASKFSGSNIQKIKEEYFF